MIDTNDYGLCSPEEIFHYEIFQDNPRLFYKFARTMLCPDKPHEPSPAHKFLSLLHDKKMLLRVYTQNVDGLEEKAGLPSKKVVYAHGSLHTSKCLKCGVKYDTQSYRHDILRGSVPSCSRIVNQRMKRQRNESQSHHDDECGNDKNKTSDITVTTCGGVVKPNITFFGEPLDDRVSKCLEVDREKADAVIVMGTSLSVAPISRIVDFLRPSIPRILINRTIVIPKHTDRADSKDIINNVNDDNNHANDDGVHAKEADFRKGYLFDALLLGFCDDITSALSHVLWCKRDDTHEQLSRSDSHGDALLLYLPDCKLLANDMAQINELGISCLLKHPPERILIFPGATWKAHCNDGDEEKVKEEKEKECYHEIVNCNECNAVITGMIFKCNDCFDYDLCKACHSKVKRKRSHYEGKHKFMVEES